MCNRTHWSLSPFMLQADGFCGLMKKDHDLAHAGRFIRFNIAIGKASISTSKNNKGYKTRSTRNDIAHVNEMSITDPSSSNVSHSGPGRVRPLYVTISQKSSINQNFHSGSTSMAQGTKVRDETTRFVKKRSSGAQ